MTEDTMEENLKLRQELKEHICTYCEKKNISPIKMASLITQIFMENAFILELSQDEFDNILTLMRGGYKNYIKADSKVKN